MSDYIVSARKYRPVDFASVIGQPGVTTTLKNSILSKKLAQAYLFCGPRGVGKTTNARIFAKTINCFNLDDRVEACNECESCISFNEGRSYNIHELDAASNNAVEDIRNLIEQVRIPPQVGKYSIYIIDEVHMLSQSAFNAFLKTLEEPPSYAVFILATTEKHKILPTILSRCQVFDFNRISIPDIVGHLKNVANSEEVTFDEDGLNIIAQKADGAMRDALSIFDQVVSFTSGNVTYEEVIQNLNVLDYDYYFKLTDAFLAEDMRTALISFDDILSNGFDAHHFIGGLSSHFRDLLVCKDERTARLLEVGENIAQRYKEQSARCQDFWLFKALEITSKADSLYKSSNNKRLHVEVMLIQLSEILNEEKKKSDRLKRQKQLQEENKSAGSVSVSATSAQTYNNSRNVSTSSAQPEMPSMSEYTSSAPISKPTVTGNSTARKSQKRSTLSIKNAVSGKLTLNDFKNNDLPQEVNEKKVEYNFSDKEVTQSDMLVAWEKAAQTYEKSSPRLYITLKSQAPKLENGNVICFEVNNISQQDAINQVRFDIIEIMRRLLSNSRLDLRVDMAEHDNSEQLILTQEDKFKHMVAANPKLLEFKKRLGLEY
jgi:DNA polymerase-3 subunit gamma/tau